MRRIGHLSKDAVLIDRPSINNYLKVEKEREENIFTEEDLPTGFDDDNDDGTIICTQIN